MVIKKSTKIAFGPRPCSHYVIAVTWVGCNDIIGRAINKIQLLNYNIIL